MKTLVDKSKLIKKAIERKRKEEQSKYLSNIGNNWESLKNKRLDRLN